MDTQVAHRCALSETLGECHSRAKQAALLIQAAEHSAQHPAPNPASNTGLDTGLQQSRIAELEASVAATELLQGATVERESTQLQNKARVVQVDTMQPQLEAAAQELLLLAQVPKS